MIINLEKTSNYLKYGIYGVIISGSITNNTIHSIKAGMSIEKPMNLNISYN